MAYSLVDAVLRLSGLRSGEKFTLAVLCTFADRKGACYPGQQKLAEITGYSDRQVRTHLDALERAGVINRTHRQRKNGSRTSDAYVVTLPADGIVKPHPTGSDFRKDRTHPTGSDFRKEADAGSTCQTPVAVPSNRKFSTGQPEVFDNPTGSDFRSNRKPLPGHPNQSVNQSLEPVTRTSPPSSAPQGGESSTYSRKSPLESRPLALENRTSTTQSETRKTDPNRDASGNLTAEETERRRQAQLAQLSALQTSQPRLGKEGDATARAPLNGFDLARERYEREHARRERAKAKKDGLQ